MAPIRTVLTLEARAEDAWDAVCDLGAVPRRPGPRVLPEARLDRGARTVTFTRGWWCGSRSSTSTIKRVGSRCCNLGRQLGPDKPPVRQSEA
jgi:hypothetical protein